MPFWSVFGYWNLFNIPKTLLTNALGTSSFPNKLCTSKLSCTNGQPLSCWGQPDRLTHWLLCFLVSYTSFIFPASIWCVTLYLDTVLYILFLCLISQCQEISQKIHSPGFGSWIPIDKHPPSEAPPANDCLSFTELCKLRCFLCYIISFHYYPSFLSQHSISSLWIIILHTNLYNACILIPEMWCNAYLFVMHLKNSVIKDESENM